VLGPKSASRLERSCVVGVRVAVEAELVGVLGELVQDSPTLTPATVLEVDEILKTHAAVAVRLLERDGALFEKLHEGGAADPEEIGRLLGGEQQALGCDKGGLPLTHDVDHLVLAEAWMHNRVRMVTASFLVKDLHQDWRRGAGHFIAHLVGADLASNHHGWQWTAGTGTDAARYHRVLKPVTQAKRFDPGGTYVRRWAPELRGLEERWLFEPWRAPGGPPSG
jgi:hypothetical protein